MGPGKGHVSPEARTLLILIVAVPLSHSISPSHAVCLLKKQNPKPKNAMIKEFVFPLHCPLGKDWELQGPSLLRLGDAFWVTQMLVSFEMRWMGRAAG